MKRFVNGWCSSRVVLPLLIDFGSGSGVLLLGGEGFGLAYGLQDQRYLLLGSCVVVVPGNGRCVYSGCGV